MLSNTVNFINQFWPERSEHWKELDEKTTQILVNSKLLTKTFESNILNVDKDPILSSLYAGNLDEIKLILSHPKQAYDILFIKDFYEKYQHGNFIRFDNQYNFIFENPKQYETEIKPLKNINNYFKRILEYLPEYYKNKNPRNTDIFGRFLVGSNNVVFQAKYEELRFYGDQIKLIPALIKYRNENLIKFVFQAKNESCDNYWYFLIDFL
mgnify:FL=1